ncbi:hypothetical protein RF683_03955 [Flavobacterium sp. 20NA77.7]|uniref:PRC-barrel domain-containing protein n=1 Tax=Flavobacterium nakdongensis TaxID=3073563 RepID=A0ABY9RBG9_9FLAO|nr:hypothetical protein [Flavobacterium sp. 20NA77.7]WMW78605.1 hypothetical protein RF683_03955 [Flavobacterium sp. 20NA77.7]
MKLDKSKIIYDKLSTLSNLNIKIKLKNSSEIIGVICGFFHGSSNFVSKWVIKQTDNSEIIITNIFDFKGVELIINHKDIIEIYFYDDKTLILL